MFDLIYKADDAEMTPEQSNRLDCARFDVRATALERFSGMQMKKLLKKKFVTGQTRDKVLENLMNQSDSDGEAQGHGGENIDAA